MRINLSITLVEYKVVARESLLPLWRAYLTHASFLHGVTPGCSERPLLVIVPVGNRRLDGQSDRRRRRYWEPLCGTGAKLALSCTYTFVKLSKLARSSRPSICERTVAYYLVDVMVGQVWSGTPSAAHP